MKKLIICVPDEMAALVREWKKWIPEMTIIQEETVVDQPKRVKEKGVKEEVPDCNPLVLTSDAERFVKRVIDIFNKVETRNNQRITTSARGHEGSYTFAVDVKGINKALNDLLKNHKSKIDDYLKGKQDCEAMTIVCPLVGYILNTHTMNSSVLQLADISFALEDFYGQSTAVNYLSKKLKTMEADLLQNTLLGLLNRYKKC